MAKYTVGEPNIWDSIEFKVYLEDILRSKQLTNNGKYVQLLEELAQKKMYMPFVAVANATLGLELIMMANNPVPGKEVIVPTFTFIASATAIERVGMVPKFVDIEPDTLGHPTKDIEKHINRNTWGMLLPQLFGSVIDFDYFQEIAWRRRIHLVLDSAHALGCTYYGYVPPANQVFSLHATKFIQGFEGGLVSTIGGSSKIREMRNFGYEDSKEWVKQVVSPGTNAKMSEVHAAMAYSNLKHIDEMITHNQNVWLWYKKYLPHFMILGCPQPVFGKSNFSYITCKVSSYYSRDAIFERLQKKGITARVYFKPIHLFQKYNMKRLVFPHAEELYERIINLPTGLAIDENVVKEICNAMVH